MEQQIENFTSSEHFPLVITEDDFILLKWIIILIGCAFALVFIHIITVVNKMRSKTNILLLNWCICNILYAILPPIVSSILEFYGITNYTYEYYECLKDSEIAAYCIFTDTQYVFTFLCIMFIIIIVNLDNMKNASLAVILFTTYTLCVILCLLEVITCHFGYSFHIIYYTALISAGCLLIAVFANRKCGKKSDKSLQRLNIGKIFLCSWMIFLVIRMAINLLEYILMIITWSHMYTFDSMILYIISFVRYLTSLFICMYLYRNNHQFKICITSLFKGTLRSDQVDSSLTFEQDFDSEIHEINNDMNLNTYTEDPIDAV